MPPPDILGDIPSGTGKRGFAPSRTLLYTVVALAVVVVAVALGVSSHKDFLQTAVLPTGTCVTKTLISVPEHTPKVPADYTVCARHLWDNSPISNAQAWVDAQTGLDLASANAFLSAVNDFFGTSSPPGFTGDGITRDGHGFFHAAGQSGALSWIMDYDTGNAKAAAVCMGFIKVELDCH